MAQTEQQRELWGGETKKAVENFPVSGEPIPAAVARWLGRIKAAAARANAELGLLDGDKAQRIAEAGDRIAAGDLDDQFPIDVFQTGSGTSSNMNANEVIASLAGDDVHANDDVNMGQSSNDVFPSAVHLAALDEITNDLLPALRIQPDHSAAGIRGPQCAVALGQDAFGTLQIGADVLNRGLIDAEVKNRIRVHVVGRLHAR